MELLLNLMWAVLAASMFCTLVRFTPRSGTDRRRQIISLALLLLLLFPVISVTDDLQTAQNPAEADCCLRRDHVSPAPHFLSSALPALPAAAFSGLCFGIIGLATPDRLFAPLLKHPELDPIQNRPPPAA